MMRRWAAMWMVGTAIMTGCPPQKPSDQDRRELAVDESVMALDESEVVVARIGGEEITLEEFERRIEGLVPFARVRVQSLERQKEFLTSLVQFEVLADVAEREGYGTSLEARHAMKERLRKLLEAELGRESVSAGELSEQELEAYFETHREEFRMPEERRLTRVVAASEEAARELRRRFEEEFAVGATGEERGVKFMEFAFRHSEDRKTGDRRGLVGVFAEGSEEFRGEQAFEMEPYQVRGPAEWEDGFELLMVTGVSPATEASFEEVESEVRTLLVDARRKEARRNFVEALRDVATIEVKMERVEAVEPPENEVPLRLEELPRMTPVERR